MAKEGQALTLNEAQIAQFISYLDGTRYPERDKAIFMLTMRAGMRIGSVAQLDLSDVLDASSKVKEVVVLKRSIVKGRKKAVAAYISHPQLREALEAYLAVRKSKRLERLFVTQRGTGFSPNSLAQVMLKHYRAAGLDGASSHSGRRVFCTSLLKKGVDIVAVSKVMGHSSIVTTQRYVHHDERELANVVSTL